MDSDLDYTMKKIIKDHIEPTIIHPTRLRKAIGKDLLPDYVAGLQKQRFAGYMEKQWAKAQLQDQPTNEDDMIFPFMVTEAKREEGDPWDYTNFQTVFPIYTMLSVQWRLLSANKAIDKANGKANDKANDNDNPFDFDPLVWYYAFRGQHWKLYLAYLDRRCEVPRVSSFLSTYRDIKTIKLINIYRNFKF